MSFTEENRYFLALISCHVQLHFIQAYPEYLITYLIVKPEPGVEEETSPV